MKIEVWCDSGANIHSCRKITVDLEGQFGITEEEWAEMSEDEKEEMCRDIAFERLDWGWKNLD